MLLKDYHKKILYITYLLDNESEPAMEFLYFPQKKQDSCIRKGFHYYIVTCT